MKLAVSSLAWDPSRDDDVRRLLSTHDVTGVEIAPLKYWPALSTVTSRALATYRQQWADAGISIVALQGILFGMPELQLFGSAPQRAALETHLGNTARVAEALGARIIVLGAPRNRRRGPLSETDAIEKAAPLLRRVAAVADELGCVLCIEPTPPQYGGDFARTLSEALEVVAAVDHPGFGLHLDAGAAQISQESHPALLEGARTARHFHISEVDLVPVGTGTVEHSALGAVLQEGGFVGWKSIEMRPVVGNVLLEALERAIHVARASYA